MAPGAFIPVESGPAEGLSIILCGRIFQMGTRVFKFGGISLSTPEGRRAAVGHCRKGVSDGSKLVVVVSAMGRNGDPYATDTLLSLVEGSPAEERDMLLCCGEVISAVVLAGALRSAGIPAKALTGWDAGIVTDGVECDSDIECVDTGPILRALGEGLCPVVAGFQGRTSRGVITTLGRGGSDTTALAIGAALEAEEVVLWKNVDSIYTADPESVPSAIKIERIGAEDLRQMSWQGARIVHPRAAEIAVGAGIPIEVRSHDTGLPVTRVEPFVLRSGRYITGVASGPPVVQFTAEAPGSERPRDFHARVFGLVAGAGISMDMFSVFLGHAMFTAGADDAPAVRKTLSAGAVQFSEAGPCAKVSIIGAGMHGMKGVMARFSATLRDAGIDMLQTVDSHATISALVPLADRDRALAALHREFVEK
jgi:aspartate kinase